MAHVRGAHEISPTARALLALEAIQNVPGITAARLGERLGVTERAARRYVAILREAELPIESVSGPYGGYQVGHGLRLPPLTFTAAEASGLVMAVLEGHKGAADPADLVGGALAKIVRVLPLRVAAQVRTIRDGTSGGSGASSGSGGSAGSGGSGGSSGSGGSGGSGASSGSGAEGEDPSPSALVGLEVMTVLFDACAAGRRLRLTYRRGHWAGDSADREMEVDPWAVVLRHSRWYLLCWSHTADARRVLRIDRIMTASQSPETFTPPAGLNALAVLEEHLSQGWTYEVDVLIDATMTEVARWLPRSLGTLTPFDDGRRAQLRASTANPAWYVGRLAVLPYAFHVNGSVELRQAAADLGRRLLAAAPPDPGALLSPGMKGHAAASYHF
jgi:predicted DNA-binding transcriptional regulator YafY